MRKQLTIFAIIAPIVLGLLGFFYNEFFWWVFGFVALLVVIGIADMAQTKHTIMRNYPIVGRARYWMEDLRPKLYQYFIESDIDGRPINRIDRNTIYQRAKKETDTIPFGTQLDVYEEGYEWMSHSIAPKDFHKLNAKPRVVFGGKDCTQKYNASIFNVSAMSFGSLSANTLEALNGGAKIGGFAYNTGECGISTYHLKQGGDIIWQIGTGYFGARNKEGNFNVEAYSKNALRPEVKMIELKLSQGAKPGHGGILPAKKNTPEIAAIRLVEPGTTAYSPPYHSAFSTPKELISFIKLLRDNCGGKPVGFKLCIGQKLNLLVFAKP